MVINMQASGAASLSFDSWGALAAFVGGLQKAQESATVLPFPAPKAPEPEPRYDAAANSKGSFDVAIDALHDRLEASRVVLAPGVELYNEDCLFVLPTLKNLAACVSDPPYLLGFMGKSWDKGDVSSNPETWKAVSDALLPGAHLVAFTGTRTYHRIACAVEDAGFEARDMLGWLYGSGFPKSMDVSKAIDKALGAERELVKPKSVINHQRDLGNRRPYMDDPDHMTVSDVPASAAAAWSGWGTALKPSFEPAVFDRKPLSEKTVAANVLKHGCGGVNVDACRIEHGEAAKFTTRTAPRYVSSYNGGKVGGVQSDVAGADPAGRWPANIMHSGEDEVLALFPHTKSGSRNAGAYGADQDRNSYGAFSGAERKAFEGSEGSAARFFYCAKVSPKERGDSKHPTMKPIALMEWLCKLVTPPGGQIVDPFMGSGSTGVAAVRNGFKFVGIEKDPESFATAVKRIRAALAEK